MNTIVITMVVTEQGEGKEPSVSHSLTVNGKPVEGALAVISVGQLPGVFVSGADTTTEMRQIALQAGGLADRMRDTALGAAISKALELERTLKAEPKAEESAPKAHDAAVPTPEAPPAATPAA